MPGWILPKSPSPSTCRVTTTLPAACAATGVSVASGTATETLNMAAIAMRSTNFREIMEWLQLVGGWDAWKGTYPRAEYSERRYMEDEDARSASRCMSSADTSLSMHPIHPPTG